MKDKIAIIGLGQMGAALLERLAAQGLDVSGFDANDATRDALRAKGFAVANQLADVLSGRGTVLTSLPNSAAVRVVWTGPDGLLTHAQPGTLCIDLSTIDPDTMRSVAALAETAGLQVVDCPVSGSPSDALAGQLVVIAGGTVAAVERARPVLSLLGETLRHSGDIGTAKVLKIVNNMMSMANLLAASEAFALGTRAGVAPDVLFDILSVSGGRSAQFLKRFPFALKGDYSPRFKMELGEKDLALGVDLGRSTGIPTPLASLVREMFALAMAQGLRGKDIVALLRMYEQWGAHVTKS